MKISEKMKDRAGHPVIEETEQEKPLGMKWHVFLVRFALWAAAVWNVFIGVLHITGLKHWLNTYSSNAIMIPEEMYINYPLLLYMDRYFAISLFVMAAYQILILVLLAKRRKWAPFHLNVMIVIMCFVSAFYDFMFENVVKFRKFVQASMNYSSSSTTVITAAVIAVALCVINWYYYNKRR